MDRWYREKFNIQTTYDQNTKFDAGYQKFQSNIRKEKEAFQQKNRVNSDDDETSRKRQRLDDNDKSKLEQDNV